MRHLQIRKLGSEIIETGEAWTLNVQGLSIDEALDLGPPGHRHKSALWDFTILLGQSVCSKVPYRAERRPALRRHRQAEDPS
jgi:hypothetical protein